jgi:hypothetical protein
MDERDRFRMRRGLGVLAAAWCAHGVMDVATVAGTHMDPIGGIESSGALRPLYFVVGSVFGVVATVGVLLARRGAPASVKPLLLLASLPLILQGAAYLVFFRGVFALGAILGGLLVLVSAKRTADALGRPLPLAAVALAGAAGLTAAIPQTALALRAETLRSVFSAEIPLAAAGVAMMDAALVVVLVALRRSLLVPAMVRRPRALPRRWEDAVDALDAYVWVVGARLVLGVVTFAVHVASRDASAVVALGAADLLVTIPGLWFVARFGWKAPRARAPAIAAAAAGAAATVVAASAIGTSGERPSGVAEAAEAAAAAVRTASIVAALGLAATLLLLWTLGALARDGKDGELRARVVAAAVLLVAGAPLVPFLLWILGTIDVAWTTKKAAVQLTPAITALPIAGAAATLAALLRATRARGEEAESG